jgi:hypothetical protein
MAKDKSSGENKASAEEVLKRVEKVVGGIMKKPAGNSPRMSLYIDVLAQGLDLVSNSDDDISDVELVKRLREYAGQAKRRNRGTTSIRGEEYYPENGVIDEESNQLDEMEKKPDEIEEHEHHRDSLKYNLSPYEFEALKSKTDSLYSSSRLNGFSPLAIHILFRRARIRLKLSVS